MRTPFRQNHGKITFVLYNKPYPCGGRCVFCFSVTGLTKSTTFNEDTTLARTCHWNGQAQLRQRFQNYKLMCGGGHKCDLAIKGDSFANHDPEYLRHYMKDIYDFLNGQPSSSLEEAKRCQLNGQDRCVSLKVETRPDHIHQQSCDLMVELGVTTVELGVPSLDDSILEINKRGHHAQAVIEATKLLREYGFEVCYQVMVGLPGSSLAKDEYLLSEKLWYNEFSPDALKIYPCLLLKNKTASQTQLRHLLSCGAWKPISEKAYLNLLHKCYQSIPRYVHINRIQRIIPNKYIEMGPSNEIDRNVFSHHSQCLWQRSVAQNITDLNGDFRNFKIISYPQGHRRYCYEAVFDKDIVLGYGRLDIYNDKAMIRDVRVLGNMLPVGTKNHHNKGCQHIGIGTAIIQAMEKTATIENVKRIEVKPSFGSMAWFIKQGYKEGIYYVTKNGLSDPPKKYGRVSNPVRTI